MVGAGLFTVKSTALEAPPPGAGLTTTTGKVPAAATSAAVIWTVNWEPLTKLVLRSPPLNLTTAPLMKLPPLTVKLKASPSTNTLAGDKLAMEGVGLLMLRSTELDVPPPGAGLNT